MERTVPAVVGGYVAALRQRAGVARAAAAATLGCSLSKISRLELGQFAGVKLRPYRHDVARLLELYGVDDDMVLSYILGLCDGYTTIGWWDNEPDLHLAMRAYLGWENAALQIRSYQPEALPSLLQTEDYARALAPDPPGPSGHHTTIDRQIEFSCRRRRLFERTDPPIHYWLIIDEGAVLVPVGSVELRLHQLDKLISEASRPQIHLQINRMAARYRPRVGAFTMLRHPSRTVPDTLVIHDELAGDLATQEQTRVDAHRHAWEQLAVLSVTGQRSVTLLKEIRDHLAGHGCTAPIPRP